MFFDKTKINKKITVLYVEDQVDIIEEFVDILAIYIDTIIVAKDGQDGYEKFIELSPDIIITDIKMPVKSGLEMIKDIRKTNKDIPIIITSAFNENKYLFEAINLGVEHYLLKPLMIDKLQIKLESIFKQIFQKRELDAYKEYLENEIEHEISLRKVEEALLLEQNKAAEVGAMVRVIAHQWKQPLHYLSLLIEDLKLEFDYQPLSTEYINEFTKKGIDRVKFLNDTMDNFLNFYKSSSKEERFDVDKVIQEIAIFLTMPFQAVGINIEIIIKNNFSIHGIENEFQQVIFNIINNAKEAFSGKKIVDAKIYLEIDVIEDVGIIKIIDNAGGIKPSKIDSIFDLEYTTKTDGNGIGLYLVKKIITERFCSSVDVANMDKEAHFTLRFSKIKKV